MRMRHIAICNLSGCTIFSTLSHKRHDLKKKTIEHNACVLSLQHLSEAFHIVRRTERDMIINEYCSTCKAPVILVKL
jgi:hypothetical protein